ncbi:MAG: 1-acyl-sn-glycerol-3-phosphate acyltransferase [Leptolyngbya sp. SIO1E4]|nr:1-acyl-sn-glycerol-3-phosphate acyltransferase [Leptolyngbya sp. SIO1E4]
MSTVGFGAAPIKPYQATTSRCSPWLTPLAYFLGEQIVLPAYFRKITVEGQENLPRTGPVILAPTHRARWDSLVLPLVAGRSATGRDLHYMVTADEVTGIQGWFIRRLGGFAVNVRSPSISSLRHGIALLQQGQMLVIYPEGGIFRDDRVHRLKPGLARLALQAQSLSKQGSIKVVPVSIRYDSPYPRWRSSVGIAIGKPLEVSAYLHRDRKHPLAAEQLKHTARELTSDLSEALVAISQTQKLPSPRLRLSRQADRC